MSRALVVLVFAAIMLCVHWITTRLVLNVTPSMAMGLYWLSSSRNVHNGDIVMACAPARFGQWGRSVRLLKDGPCDGVEAVLKRVVAVAGNHIKINNDGVFVDGKYLNASERNVLLDDGLRCSWRAPVAYASDVDRVLRSGEVELLGDNREWSYDGRYWGITDRVLGRAVRIVAL